MSNTFLDAIVEVDKILDQCASSQDDASPVSKKSPAVSAAAPAAIAASASAAAIGTAIPILGPIGLMAAATGAAIRTIAHQSSAKSSSAIRFVIRREQIPDLKNALSTITAKWDTSLDRENRLTAYVALFNGCALYCVPKSVCLELVQSCARDDEKVFLTDMVEFVSSQLEADTNCILGVYNSDILRKYSKNPPHVVSLYYFVAAVAQFLPGEQNEHALGEARRHFKRMSEPHRDFVLLKNQRRSFNPALHQYLLPQLEKNVFSAVESSSRTGSLDYFGRVSFLHLRVPVYYNEVDQMSMSAKLQAMFEADRYVYQAIENEYTTQSILRDFAHTFGNMKTTRLESIAENLFRISAETNNQELLRLARQALLEVKNQRNLSTSIQLMHMRCRGEIDKLIENLADSVVNQADASSFDTEDILGILDNALLLSLYRILYDGSDQKAGIARNHMRPLVESWSTLTKSFEDHVVVAGQSCVSWLNDGLFPAQLNITSNDGWQHLYFYKGSFASVLLVDLLAETLFNALKYADLSAPITISFAEKDEFLSIEAINKSAVDVKKYTRGVGLNSRRQTMSVINGCKRGVSAFVDNEGNHHAVIELRKSFFF